MKEKQEPIIIKLSTMIFIIIIILLAIGVMTYDFLKDQEANTEMINSLKNDINKIEKQIEVLENNSETNNEVENKEENNTENSIKENNIETKPTNIVKLDSKEFKQWKLGKVSSNKVLSVINGPEEKEDENMTKTIEITIYKPIKSSKVKDVKKYIEEHSFEEGFIDGENMSFVKEDEVNSNNWMEFTEQTEGNYLYNHRVYAANEDNNLCIISVMAEESMDKKYKSEIDEVINTIESSWNLTDGNNLKITIK